ncbi:arylsulfatase regulator [Candidatus Fukatsuia symbiotica]|uniref:Arylsulfatase regulator n=1 Tax=Candidatus Fukatsuia symbiotica TaxID=1878942 RepID=A0A2U8IBE0_9GAMM|nr:arylsulfatase regulator [Candidatus Fukatsuia symbiotica]AWK15684.1 arylsulfatase regulator [Candidatus Fukatsuia symbiotica]MEA9446251.1 arylsulfatase regulator [Candidatus Fukatsuia symbiotica]
MIDLSAEQRHMIKLIDDYAAKFPLSEVGDEQLLSTCYDYMGAFKRILDSTSKRQMDYICQQYDGFYRFAKLMEMLAQGLADEVIEVPKDH